MELARSKSINLEALPTMIGRAYYTIPRLSLT